MRKGVPIAALAACVLVVVTTASGAPPPKRYYELAVDASFYSNVDYGDDPTQLVTGVYQYHGSYQLRAVVIFENRNLRIPERGAVVAARVVVKDERKKIDARDPQRKRRIPVCRGWETSTQGRESGGNRSYVPARQAGIAISGGTLKVAPDLPITWKLGCAEVESLERHLLPAGPDAKVSAPPYARFQAGVAAARTCVDRAAHGASHPHGRAYTGEVAIRTNFAPIAKERLSTRLEVLRELVGRGSRSRLSPSHNKGKTCL